ncbi:MAG: glycosyltransferase [Gammaproteobacteria bacterium]|nr:glycosyltransferase [Gammaproteobacteria bacterium]
MRPTLSLAMICKDSAKTLPDCLKSIKPFVDEIVIALDDRTSDATAKIAKKSGAKVVPFKWTNDFSAARQISFDATTSDYSFWADDDDTIEGAERIMPLLEKYNPDSVVLPYYYDKDKESGNWLSILSRERIVKKEVGWHWENRVHEVLVPSRQVSVARDANIKIIHHRPEAKYDPTRNIRLLEMMWEIDHKPRALAYLGHEYFHQRQWAKAMEWYERYTDNPDWLDEQYSVLCRLSDCYMAIFAEQGAKEGQLLEQANDASLRALDIHPEWADAYFMLARVAGHKSEWDRVIFWTEMGNQMQPMDIALSINPLDYNFHPLLYLECAMFKKHGAAAALDTVEKALKVYPGHKPMSEKKDYYEKHIQRENEVSALISMAARMNAEDVAKLAEVVPKALYVVPQVRDVLLKPSEEHEIVFLCGQGLEDWSPMSLNKGLGGSETAVVYLARGLYDLGHKVTVYGAPGKDEGVHDGVEYWDFRRWKQQPCDVLIASRMPEVAEAKTEARIKVLWCHDLHMYERLTPERMEYFDNLFVMSEFQRKYMLRLYPFILPEKFFVTANGIDLDLFQNLEVERDPHRLIYTSSPDRGLTNLLCFWPIIRQRVPDATLHIYYGLQMMEKAYRWQGHSAEFKNFQNGLATLIKQPGVEYHGRVGKKELATEMAKSAVLAYPTEFLEISFITGMEAMAAGCVPVVTASGALPETIGDGGILIKGYPRNDIYQKMWIGSVLALLTQPEIWKEHHDRALTRAQRFSWKGVIEQWDEFMFASSLRQACSS